jgi:hypothetical protein
MNADTVFILRGECIERMPARPFREGVGSATLEVALQNLLSAHPDLIPGGQVSPDASTPPRFALLGAEVTIDGRYSVDHVMVDSDGVPTLIETKLFENPDSRRDVIGQILEYAALGLAEWGNGVLRGKAAAYWGRKNMSVDDMLQSRFGPDFLTDEFWTLVEANLQSGSVRLIIAGDQIRPDVRRVIEMLNSEMENIDIFGLELGCYGESGEEFVLVPRIVGQTIRAVDRKGAGKVRPWSPDELRSRYRSIASDAPDRAHRLDEILDWALQESLYVRSISATPCFALGDNDGTRLVTVNPDGLLHWYAGEHVYAGWGGEPTRRHFYDGLVALGLAGEHHDPDLVKSSRDLLRRVEDLSGEEFSRFKELVSKTIQG